MSRAKTRAFGSRSSSMSRRTLSSFWNEQASATFGWSASRTVSTTCSADSVSTSVSPTSSATLRSIAANGTSHERCLSMLISNISMRSQPTTPFGTRPAGRIPVPIGVRVCAAEPGACDAVRTVSDTVPRQDGSSRPCRAAPRVGLPHGRARRRDPPRHAAAADAARPRPRLRPPRRRRVDDRRHRARAARTRRSAGRASSRSCPARYGRSSSPTSTPTTSARRPTSSSSRSARRAGRLDYEQCRLVWGGSDWADVLVDWFRRHGVPDDVMRELIEQGSAVAAVHPLPARSGAPRSGRPRRRVAGRRRARPRRRPADAARRRRARRGRPRPRPDLADRRALAAEPPRPARRLPRRARGDDRARGAHRAPGPRRADPRPGARARGRCIAHHAERLAATAARSVDEPRSGYEVSFPLFGDDLKPAARRFAVAETLSHLERLVLEGGARRITRTTEASPILRRRSGRRLASEYLRPLRGRRARISLFPVRHDLAGVPAMTRAARARRCRPADPPQRVLRRGRVLARDGAADPHEGARRRGQPHGALRRQDHERPAALHRRDAARRDADLAGDRRARRAGAVRVLRPVARDDPRRAARVPDHHLPARGGRRARPQGDRAELLRAHRARRVRTRAAVLLRVQAADLGAPAVERARTARDRHRPDASRRARRTRRRS